MGNMHSSTKKLDESDFIGEFASWVRDQLKGRDITVSRLADDIGESRSETSRAINGKRKFSYREVVKISQRFGIQPPPWNNIGNPSPESRFLPLCGNIAANVWRVKGEGMPYQSPIRPIDIGEGDTREQHCYFVSEGPFQGEYVVCIKPDDAYELENDDIVVVSETQLILSLNINVTELTLRIVRKVDGETRICLIEEGDDDKRDALSPEAKVVGLAIGFFRSTKKFNGKPAQDVDRSV